MMNSQAAGTNATIPRGFGFTLIEVMIVVVVISILVAIAYPSYKLWINKGRRADGTTALLDLANRMQRYYTENNTFATATIAAGVTATDVLTSATSPQGYYTLSFYPAGTPPTANAYTLLATRAGVQVGDTQCGDLMLTSTNVRDIVHNAPGVTWDKCW